MKKIYLLLLPLVLLFSTCEKENNGPNDEDPDPNETVNIPDNAFLFALINEGVNTNGDSLINYAEAEAVTTLILEIDARDLSYHISDMTGIEAFINLDSLNCSDNDDILDIDLSKNTKLKYLECHAVQPYCQCGCFGYTYGILETLDLSNNGSLEYLDCSYQQ